MSYEGSWEDGTWSRGGIALPSSRSPTVRSAGETQTIEFIGHSTPHAKNYYITSITRAGAPSPLTLWPAPPCRSQPPQRRNVFISANPIWILFSGRRYSASLALRAAAPRQAAITRPAPPTTRSQSVAPTRLISSYHCACGLYRNATSLTTTKVQQHHKNFVII